MKCSVCKVNTAVIFVTKMTDNVPERLGMCLPCASKQGVSPIDQMLRQSGMSPDDLNNLNEQMMQMFEDPDISESLNNFMSKMTNNDESGMMNAFAGVPGDDEFETDSDPSDLGVDNGIEADDEDDNKKSESGFGIPLGNIFGNKTTKVKEKPSKNKRKNLDTFGINLTEKAKLGEVDRIIGRHREIDRVIQILNRRQKNNPILIGEPGVGKTAIAEGLAVRIVEGQVPTKLLDAEVYLLDLTALVAGTQFRGQFEGRMKAIINEAKNGGNIILVIDEVHNIAGAGEAESGAMNAANILKPALARGDVQIIGATTIDEYRKHIEKDTALERRFQPVLVEEPSIEESIEIIKGIKDYYEDFHKVIISDDMIELAVRMSERYIHERYLPDKAIDVIDEAGSRANLKNMGLVELEALRNQLAKVVSDKEDAAALDDFEKAAELRVQELKLTDKINKIEVQCENVHIVPEDIAYVIEAWTKIPVQSINEDEREKLLHLEERLRRRVKGQDHSIDILAKSIRRNRSGFKKRFKPSSFIFVGPTGVGKTELSKALAAELFDNEEAMIRFDMSEYMEKHTVSKLIGAPPGYVGYDQAGQLTERVRRKPYSVILLDEIEKAHSDVYNLLLQILEDGRLTDSQGRSVNFENTIIIMTSNAGTTTKSSTIGFNNESQSAREGHIHEALKEFFRPEFMNRVDETIIFNPLTKDVLGEIVGVMLKEVIAMGREKKIEISVSKEVEAYLVSIGYDEKFGARPLRRAIGRYIEDEIAERYIKGEVKEGSLVEVLMEDNHVVVRNNYA